MIRAGVLSAEDHFHRDVRRHAADAGVRVDLVLRSATELRTSGGLDVVIVHSPSADDLEFVQEVVGSLPIVVAGPGAFHSDTLRAQDGWAMVPDDDPSGVVAAARAPATAEPTLGKHRTRRSCRRRIGGHHCTGWICCD